MRYITFCLALLTAGVLKSDDNIVIVFDTSGSMDTHMRSARQSRMEVAQKALTDVLSQVPSGTNIGILTFRGWAYELGPVKGAELTAAISGCSSNGGTPLYAYIKTGASRLLQERQKKDNIGYYKLIVVTDGFAQDVGLNEDTKFRDGSLKLGVLKDVISRGIMVDTIALEMESDHPLKNQINGTYMKGDDLKSIHQSLKKAIAEVGFNGDDTITGDIFSEIGQFPDNFSVAVIKGLTEFRNHPIGEPPPIKVVMPDGTIQEQAFVDDSWSFGTWFLWGSVALVIGVVVCCSLSNL